MTAIKTTQACSYALEHSTLTTHLNSLLLFQIMSTLSASYSPYPWQLCTSGGESTRKRLNWLHSMIALQGASKTMRRRSGTSSESSRKHSKVDSAKPYMEFIMLSFNHISVTVFHNSSTCHHHKQQCYHRESATAEAVTKRLRRLQGYFV